MSETGIIRTARCGACFATSLGIPPVTSSGKGEWTATASGSPPLPDRFDAVFELPHVERTLLLVRTHPFVEALASHLVGTAIDDPAASKAARSGAIRTVEAAPALAPWRDSFAGERAKSLLAVHRQLRDESRIKGLKYDVGPQLPVDVLGVSILLPAGY